MAVFAIGDLHLSLGTDKPMDVFPGWKGYKEKLERSWNALVRPEDTVVLAGDTSWAMKLEDTGADFAFLQSLPGRKLLLKGNHDYWWCTKAKMDRYLEQQGFTSLAILHNNSFSVEGLAICGTRSWLFDAGQPHDEKVMNRELGRLRMSLDAAGDGEKVVFLHYPPVHGGAVCDEIFDVLKRHGIRKVYHGHIHGAGLNAAVKEYDGVQFKLISCDCVDFTPVFVV